MDVWLVEDDDLVAIPFTMWIERLGHNVTTFRRAHEVLQALELEQPPSIMITDMTLPGMNGVELIRRVRACAGGELPVILMSGHDVDTRALRFAQPFAFLPKPVDLNRLEETIARFIGQAPLKGV